MVRDEINTKTINVLVRLAKTKGKQAFLRDSKQDGFGLRATPSGSIAAIVETKRIGRETLKGFDCSSPAAILASLDDMRHEARKIVGWTPSQDLTLSEAVRLFLDAEGDNSSYWQQARSAWINRILPFKVKGKRLADQPCRRLEMQHYIAYIDSLSIGTRYNHFMFISAFLTWAKPRKYIQEHWLRDIPPPKRNEPRERRHDEDEVRAFWLATDDPTCPYKTAYRVSLLTCLRSRSEVACIQLNEFEDRTNDDGEQETWVNIPGARTKNRRAHSFYCTPLTQKCFDTMLSRNKALGWNTPYLFACLNGIKTLGARGEGNWNRKAKQVHKRMEAILGRQVEHFRIHDLRRTVSWFLAAEGVSFDVRKTIRGHAMPRLDGTYDTHGEENLTKPALLKWEARLQRIVHGV